MFGFISRRRYDRDIHDLTNETKRLRQLVKQYEEERTEARKQLQQASHKIKEKSQEVDRLTPRVHDQRVDLDRLRRREGRIQNVLDHGTRLDPECGAN